MEPLKITDEMRNERQERIDAMCDRVNESIKNALTHHRSYAYFPCDKVAHKDIYDEVRVKYEKAGYVIKPTGVIAGVWQLTEDICW